MMRVLHVGFGQDDIMMPNRPTEHRVKIEECMTVRPDDLRLLNTAHWKTAIEKTSPNSFPANIASVTGYTLTASAAASTPSPTVALARASFPVCPCVSNNK